MGWGRGKGGIPAERTTPAEHGWTGGPSHIRTCTCFRVLKLGLIRGARQGLGHEGSHLLVYRELSIILEALEAIPGCEGSTYNLRLFVTIIIEL